MELRWERCVTRYEYCDICFLVYYNGDGKRVLESPSPPDFFFFALACSVPVPEGYEIGLEGFEINDGDRGGGGDRMFWAGPGRGGRVIRVL